MQGSANEPPFRCPECGSRELTLIGESECVTIYKCPQCGRLQAPVKNTQAPPGAR